MLSFHSLSPAKLYTGTQTKAAPKPKPAAMLETQTAAAANSHDGPALASKLVEPRPVALAQQHTAPSHESRDSGVADLESASEPQPPGPEPKPEPKPGGSLAGGGSENQTASIDFSSSAGPSSQPARPPSAARSSLQRDADIRPAPPPPRSGPDETHHNAIAYRRDPETVIAYLVPLPRPTVQGTQLDVPTRYFLYAPPPPHLVKPPSSSGSGSGAAGGGGGGEGYVRRLNRRWQQSVHKSKTNARNGRRVSLRGTHSKAVRGIVRGLDRLKYDDVTFLARVHPSTVTHLILIHPSGLSSSSGGGDGGAEEAPEDLLRTFRAQVFESKKKAKRGSILSAALFFPALAIDTAAIFFGGLAEVDGIWMLVSIKAYRTARVITRKIGPEPKTLQVEQEQLIEDAKRSGFPPPRPEVDEEEDSEEPGAIRRSVDALRRSMGSVTYRMNYKRSRGKKAKGGDSSSDTSRPQTNDASRSDIEGGFMGGELEHHQEEEEGGRAEAAGTSAAAQEGAAPRGGQSEPELSGWLEHATDDEDAGDGAPGPSNSQPSRGPGSGGILVDGGNTDEPRSSAESDENGDSKKGENFQLTFYPSPAMEVLTRYLQEACHRYNGQAFSSPAGTTTEQDVLDVMGWHPEKRDHDTAEEIAEDEQWQRRDIEDDLRLVAIKAAKAWDKSCRKAAKSSKRPMSEKPSKKRVFAGRFKARRPRLQKGKGKETPAVSYPEADAAATDAAPAAPAAAAATTTAPTSDGQGHAANIRARMAAVRDRARRKETASHEEPTSEKQQGQSKRSRAAGTAALLCVPCTAIAKRAKRGKKGPRDETNENEGGDEQAQAQGQARTDAASRGAMRQRFSARSSSVKRGLSTTTGGGGGTLRQRIEARRGAKKGSAGEGAGAAGPAPGMTDQPARASEAQTADVEADAPQPKKSKAGRLLAIPAAVAAAIGAVIKKRRQGTKTSADEGDASSTTGVRGTSKFSALKRHLRSLRTRVTKKRSAAGLRDYFKGLKQKRKAKKEESQTMTEPKSVKEHGAIVGLVGGFLALPAAKVREVRDKRRHNKPASESSEAPVNTGSAETASTVDGYGRISHDRPRFEPPISEEEEDDAHDLSPPPSTTQYLPGHGQSEVPVAAARESVGPQSDPRLGSSETAVDEAPGIPEPQQSPELPQGAPTAAGGRFRSFKNGIGGLKPKRRAAEETTDQAAVSEPTRDPLEDELASPGGGRFQALRDGLGNLKPKKRAGAEAPQPEGPLEALADAGIVKNAAPPGDSVPKEGRFKSIKDGFGNLKAKKTGTEEAPKQKVYKDSANPGFMDRMRWLWLMS